jgi:hypothetical protein
VLLLAALVTGCGPVEYVSQVSRRATTALAQARNEGAERLAPYEYTAASEYLNKAREEASHSAYQRAIDYGRRAEELAARAGSLARDRAARGETPPAGRP